LLFPSKVVSIKKYHLLQLIKLGVYEIAAIKLNDFVFGLVQMRAAIFNAY